MKSVIPEGGITNVKCSLTHTEQSRHFNVLTSIQKWIWLVVSIKNTSDVLYQIFVDYTSCNQMNCNYSETDLKYFNSKPQVPKRSREFVYASAYIFPRFICI